MKIHAQLCFIAALIGSHYSLVKADDASECGVPDVISNIDARIVGGVEATPHSWPWQVSINCSENDWQYRCGGSVLHPHWVITAAHCVYYGETNKSQLLSSSDFKIALGKHNLLENEETEQVVEVSQIIPHECYDNLKGTYDNDIALIRLKEDVDFNRYIHPICLPNVDDVKVNASCVVTGWGATKDKEISSFLQQAEVEVISRVQCNKRDWHRGRVTENMICAGVPEGGKDACKSDTGSPLVSRSDSDGRWYLFGLVSWSEDCARRHKPGVYTRVTRYLKWIQEKTGQEIKTDNLPKKGTDGSSDSEPTETEEIKNHENHKEL